MNILILEDNDERIKWFESEIPHTLNIVKTAVEAIELLKTNVYDIIFLDHDLGNQAYVPSGPGTGYEVAEFITGMENCTAQIIIHSWNSVGAENIQKLLPSAKRLPFGTFKWNLERL